jgi:hypothetical protein
VSPDRLNVIRDHMSAIDGHVNAIRDHVNAIADHVQGESRSGDRLRRPQAHGARW